MSGRRLPPLPSWMRAAMAISAPANPKIAPEAPTTGSGLSDSHSCTSPAATCATKYSATMAAPDMATDSERAST